MKSKMKPWKKRTILAICFVIVAVVSFGFGSGYMLFAENGPQKLDIVKKLTTMDLLVDNYYLYEKNTDKIENEIYKGYVKGLDDTYAQYYTPKEYKNLLEEESGEYKGIGVTIFKDPDSGYVTISEVIKGSPAYKRGLMPEDYILKVNGEETVDMELTDVVTSIKGSENEKAKLSILRGNKTFEKIIEVTDVVIESVEYELMEKDTGYISVSQFIENTSEKFINAIDDLSRQGMKKLIIDLRDNGGGLVNTATSMLSRIIKKGDLLTYTQDKYGNRQEYTSDSDETLDIPIVILTNEYSASASELFTGCLKDYHKAIVIGEKTFGKGIVQTVLNMSDGSAIKFTIASYYTPNGVCIHNYGIEPDIKIELSNKEKVSARVDRSKDKVLKRALEYMKKQ